MSNWRLDFSFRVFLSHSNSDNELVDLIDREIRLLGMSCYVDNRDVRAGVFIPEIIKDEIEDCNVFVPIYSKNGFESRWVHEEVGMAYYADKSIIVICTPDVDFRDLQTQIGQRAITLDPNSTSEGIARLKDNLIRLRRRTRLGWLGLGVGVWLIWRHLKKRQRQS